MGGIVNQLKMTDCTESCYCWLSTYTLRDHVTVEKASYYSLECARSYSYQRSNT